VSELRCIGTRTTPSTRTTHAALAWKWCHSVPSAATCTGDKVLLDGRDTALIRIATVDANGVPTNAGGPTGGLNVSVEVVSGPGRLVGVGSG
jgi:hypothetical protein